MISSYLVANDETWHRGIALSFASAILQAFTAVTIVGIAVVLLGAMSNWNEHAPPPVFRGGLDSSNGDSAFYDGVGDVQSYVSTSASISRKTGGPWNQRSGWNLKFHWSRFRN